MKTIQFPNCRWAALPVALLMTTLAALPVIANTQVAFVSDQADNWNNWDIYLRDLVSGATTRLTTNPAIDNHPDLSPDGTWVVWSSTRGGGEFDLWLGDVANVEGTLRQLTFHDHPNGPQTLYPSRHPHFHPNGRMIIFSSKNRPLDSPITIISECSSPKIIVPPRFYEGLNVIQLDASGKATNYIELDIRNAWDSVSIPDVWVPGTGTYVGHPSFSHGGDKIVFSGSIDGDGKVWEVYVAGFDPATGSLITNSLRRVTEGPDFGPNPIKMSAGAHFTEDDSQILFSSTRTAMGNSQIFRLPASAVDAPVTTALQMTSHPANDYVPEPLMDGSFIVTSDLGTNGLCWPGPGPTADLDLVRINSGGGRQMLGNEPDNELLLIADEVSWFCGLKPNLSQCTFQPRIMNGEALWLESTAYDNPTNSPIPPDLLAGFGYPGQAVNLYSNGFRNMSQYMTTKAARTWESVMNSIQRLNASRFPGLDDKTALSDWLARTESTRNQKFVVASIMQSLGVGPPQAPVLSIVRQGTNVVISWPSDFSGYALEQTASLNAPINWTSASVRPVLDRGQYVATLPIGSQNQFLRLRKVSATVVTIEASDPEAAEGGSNPGEFRVIRSGDLSGNLTVVYVVSGTAIPGSDYTPLPDSVVIAPGLTGATIPVVSLNDTIQEGDETVILALAAGANYVVGSPRSAAVTIHDAPTGTPLVTIEATDPQASEAGPDLATIKVTRSGNTSAPLTVFYELRSSAGVGSDILDLPGSLTIPAGANSGMIQIVPIDDNLGEGEEFVSVRLLSDGTYALGLPAAATVTIADDEPVVTIVATDALASELGLDSGTITVTRTGATSTALTVFYAASGSATPGSDYAALPGSIVIPSGATSAQILVNPVNNAIAENDEEVIVTLIDGPGYLRGTLDGVGVLITDDEPQVIIEAVTSAVREGSLPGQFKVTRSGSTASSLIVLYAVSGTATPGSDYSALSGTVTVPAGANSAVIQVQSLPDPLLESADTIVITLLADSAYSVSAGPAEMVIQDSSRIIIEINETPTKRDDITVFTPSLLTINARITSQADVTIDLSVNPARATLSQTTLTLQANQPQIITITPTARSAAPNDVTIEARIHDGGPAIVGMETFTIANVELPQHIRSTNTPAQMPDRIPPHVDTAFQVTIEPNLANSGQTVTLRVDGQSGANGRVTLNRRPDKLELSMTADVNFRGGPQQTAASAGGGGGGHAGNLQLVAEVRGIEVLRRHGFSVAAIPENWTCTFTNGLFTGLSRGIHVIDGWNSDSGNIADLNEVEISEEVQYGAGTGVFAGVGTDNSGYLPATSFTTDSHSTPVSFIRSSGGSLVAEQTSKFLDRRTGVVDIPMTRSGYRVTRTVVQVGGVWNLTTSKVGAATTANGITSGAGATVPGAGITATQPP